MARRFAEADVARNHGAEDFLLEELPHVVGDLLAEVRAFVDHREEHAIDVERGVERGADAAHRADEIGEAFEREVLAVQRNQHGVGGDERVQREQAERRGAIDEDVIVLVAERRDEGAQPFLAVGECDELDLGAGEIAVGRDEAQAIDAGRDDERGGGGKRNVGGQRVVDRAAGSGFAFLSDAAREIALGIDVDEQDAPAGEGERGGEVDGGGGFADATFLVGDGYDAAQVGCLTYYMCLRRETV